MTTFYLDFEGGNDANDGLSFANRWKTFANGATAARIAPGDEIRVMASPDPTSIGNATWTDGPRPATVTVLASTNTSPIAITTSTAHGLVTGDYVAIAGHATNTNANGVWKVGTVSSSTVFEILQMDGSNTTSNGSGSGGTSQKATNCIVKLAAPITQNIALCGGQAQKPTWTASANVTTGKSTTDYKEGYTSAQIAPLAAFTTGKAAYYTLPSTLDLSGYQQVCLWVRQSAGTLATYGQVYLALCSDTLGNTVVNQVDIPAIGALSQWHAVTVNLGTNLGSSINSVALYVATDLGAQTFQLDNIFAAKAASSADSLTLNSLISKNTGTEAWFPIQSINYDAVMLANTNFYVSTNSLIRGYSGTTETVTTYKREATRYTAPTSSATLNIFTDSGTITAPIAYSGGWNRTDMSTQTGETWYDGVNGSGFGFSFSGTSVKYVSIDKLNAVRCVRGYNQGNANNQGAVIGSAKFVGCAFGIYCSGDLSADTVDVNNCQTSGVSINGIGARFSAINNASNCGIDGITYTTSANNNIIGSVTANNNGTYGINIGSFCGNTISYATVKDNGSWGIYTTSGYDNVIGGGSTSGNTNAGVHITTGKLYLNNFTINEVNEISNNGTYGQGFVYATRFDNTDNNSWVFQIAATINQQSSVVDSPATTAWKLTPSTVLYYTQYSPLKLKLGTVVCAAGSLVTVTARMRKTDAGLVGQLACPGGQISGVPNEVKSAVVNTNTWETVTITFTPTEAGAVDIYAYTYGNSNQSLYVCNLTASQA